MAKVQLGNPGLCVELTARRITFVRQHIIRVEYRGCPVGEGLADLIVDNTIVVELKTVEAIAPIHTAQLLSYMKATTCRLGLVINFNVPILKEGIKRVILSQ